MNDTQRQAAGTRCAGAKVLGPVRLGTGAQIGANAVVVNDESETVAAMATQPTLVPARSGAASPESAAPAAMASDAVPSTTRRRSSAGRRATSVRRGAFASRRLRHVAIGVLERAQTWLRPTADEVD